MVFSTIVDLIGLGVEVAHVGGNDRLELIDITRSEEVVINDIEDVGKVALCDSTNSVDVVDESGARGALGLVELVVRKELLELS